MLGQNCARSIQTERLLCASKRTCDLNQVKGTLLRVDPSYTELEI